MYYGKIWGKRKILMFRLRIVYVWDSKKDLGFGLRIESYWNIRLRR